MKLKIWFLYLQFNSQNHYSIQIFLIAKLSNGSLEYLFKEISEEKNGRFNDVIADPEGRVFCGTMPDQNGNARLYKLDKIDSSDITIKPKKFSRGGRVKFEHGDVAVNKTLPSSTEFNIVSTTETENPDRYIVGDKLNEEISFTEEEVIELPEEK